MSDRGVASATDNGTTTGPGRVGPADGRIEVRHLTKRFGGFTAVDDLSFDVQPGRITGFLGPNGAGKTTTLRMVLGLVRPTSGTATIGGRRYHDILKPLTVVGSALEATNFHPGRTGRDHLRVLADTAGIDTGRVDEMLELVGLPAAARKRAGGYSMGMRQRLGLAAALLGDPQVLLLDEPANGLDPEGIRWLRGFLRHLSSRGKTILVSSHMLQEVEQTVDDVVIINNGRLIKQGSIEELHGEARTLVRTTDVDTLAGALRVSDVTSEAEEDGALLVDTGDLRLVGDVALKVGVPVHELRSARSDLEALFFELTEGQNRNLETGGDPTSGGEAAEPAARGTEEGGA
jgi:ABC-2 type transport system ATP-binding protein